MLLSTSRVQHVPTPGQQTNYTDADTGKQVARLPSDIALRTSSGLSYWTLAYAMNEGPFVHDFQRVFQRLLQVCGGSGGVGLGGGVGWHCQACLCKQCAQRCTLGLKVALSDRAKLFLEGALETPYRSGCWLPAMQFGAGKTWMPLTTYKWKGLKGDAPDFGTDIKPQVSRLL